MHPFLAKRENSGMKACMGRYAFFALAFPLAGTVESEAKKNHNGSNAEAGELHRRGGFAVLRASAAIPKKPISRRA